MIVENGLLDAENGIRRNIRFSADLEAPNQKGLVGDTKEVRLENYLVLAEQCRESTRRCLFVLVSSR